ncbi:MAG: DUF1349 domain-containing protein [Deltaproteobacteria bacterium]|nr:DUF1349 domain-containing protein [Deltaproteobacteria bacterium]
MTILFYSLIVMTPLLFLLRRPRRELLAAAGLTALFLLVNGRLATGAETVSWDTLFWSTEFQYIRELVQSGHLPGWNPFFNSGEPLYMYHQHYAMWQWFAFALIDKVIPANPVALFNLSFLFLFVFYNAGCYLFFTKLFKDARVILYSFAVSLFSAGFVMHFQEFESLHFSIYFPYILYFLTEFAEQGRWDALALGMAITGIAVNAYVPHYLVLALVVFAASYLAFMDRAHLKAPVVQRSSVVRVAIGALLMLIAAAPVFFIFTRWGEFISPMRTGLEDYMNQTPAITGHHQDWKAIFNFFNVTSYTSMRAKLFIGVIPVVLAMTGAMLSKNRYRWTVIFAALLVYFVSLGRGSFIYSAMHFIPTFNLIRNYVEFEIFVQFLIICLSGMGLEYITCLKDGERWTAASFCAAAFGIAALFYGLSWMQEERLGGAHLVPPPMYAALFAVSAIAVLLLLQTRSKNAYAFFFIALILCLATFQWNFGYLNYQKLKWSEDDGELARLNELLSKKVDFAWRPTRAIAYDQRLKVAEYYNTFEPALDGVERAFAEPVEKNLLVPRRYYDLRDLRHDEMEYFGADYPKIFITRNYRAVNDEDVIATMKSGYRDFIKNGTVVFAKGDLSAVTRLDALGRITAAYDTGLRKGASASDAPHETPDASVFSYHVEGADNDAIEESGYGDEFDATQTADGGGKLMGWNVLNASSAATIDANKTYPGKLVIAPTSANTYFWNDTFTAPFVYKEVSRDFDVQTRVEANHDKDNEAAGLMIRDASNGGNWLGFLVGISGGKQRYFFTNTINGKTTFITKESDEFQLRAARRGDVFTFYSRRGTDVPWTLRARTIRSDLGKIAQVGLAAQANNAAGTYSARFDYARFKKAGHAAYAGQGSDGINVREYGPDTLDLTVNAQEEALLVYLQNYDRDWRAYVNGVETPIRRVNYNFQSIAVPPGTSVVEFRYRSAYRYLLALHLASAIATVALMAFYRPGKNGETNG